MTVALEINTLHIFDDTEQARKVGQAIELLLGRTEGGVRLRELPTHKRLPLYPAVIDPKRIKRGTQEVDGRITNIVREIRSEFTPALTEVDFTEGVKVLDGNQYVVDYQRLLNNIREHVTIDLATFNEAVSRALTKEALRGIK